MGLVVPTYSLPLFLDAAAALVLSGARLKLFQNDWNPTIGDTPANYTECDFPGYASVSLTLWGSAGVVSGVGLIQEQVRTFAMSGASPTNLIFGYYVTDATGSTLLFAERSAVAPYSIDAIGKTYSVLPRFSDTQA